MEGEVKLEEIKCVRAVAIDNLSNLRFVQVAFVSKRDDLVAGDSGTVGYVTTSWDNQSKKAIYEMTIAYECPERLGLENGELALQVEYSTSDEQYDDRAEISYGLYPHSFRLVPAQKKPENGDSVVLLLQNLGKGTIL